MDGEGEGEGEGDPVLALLQYADVYDLRVLKVCLPKPLPSV